MRTVRWLCSGLFSTLLLASCGGGGGPGVEEPLARHLVGTSGSGFPGVFDEIFVLIRKDGDVLTLVGDGRPLMAADSGTSVSIGPSDDAQFLALAAVLTNGIDDLISVRTQSAAGGGETIGPESSNLEGLLPGVPNPDLTGFTLTRIEIRVDQLTFSHPMGTTTMDFTGSIIFHGVRY